jgi:hypothetical protein
MAAARSRKSIPRAETDRRAASVRPAEPDDVAAPSPARRQQTLLDTRWRVVDAPPVDEPGRWSRRRTLAFIGLTCGGFWTCVIIGATQLLR